MRKRDLLGCLTFNPLQLGMMLNELGETRQKSDEKGGVRPLFYLGSVF
jgi:hypothetical protein